MDTPALHILYEKWRTFFKPSSTFCEIQRCFNTLRIEQNDRHLADDNVKCIFVNENVWASTKISLKFAPDNESPRADSRLAPSQ